MTYVFEVTFYGAATFKGSGKSGCLTVSALDSGSKGPGSSPDWGHLLKGCGVTCNNGLTSHPGGVAVVLVASCYRNSASSSSTCARLVCRLLSKGGEGGDSITFGNVSFWGNVTSGILW